ncbi:trigger factor [Peptoanaerobacter stomatis]|uniref:Trigger factor n=1 Tax=Peptoanaerobacter stomatis TaxID=796937 RepID=J5WLL7_9FIRM|nr:trigger factor [Peptoanaerobacter stomatis]EJU22862.1 trigger factor [Peptoanaerobacter stomatis]NWO25561.1 trigger factor [Peptostreptococcaceae bacterium oral taxon 081]
MSLELLKKEGYNAELKMVINSADFEKYCTKAYNKNKGKISIPGFRKGKVPKQIIEKYYGVGFFYEDALNDAFSEEFSKGVEQIGIEPVARPVIDVEEIETGKDVVIDVKVVIKPDIEIGQYKGLEVKFGDTTPTDEEVERELENRRNQNARFVTIEDRAVKDGDIVKLDFEGKKDGVPFEGGKGENYSLTIGSKSFIDGFEEQLIGMNIGEEKVIEVTFPQEYMEKSLAGQKATFDVKINEIKEKQLPELDDEFVKDISEFDTLDQLKEDIKKTISQRKEKDATREFENDIIEQIVKNSKIDLPQEMIDTEADHMFNEFAQGLSYQGMNVDMYSKYINKSIDELKNEMKPEAEKRVKGSLVLEKVKKLENVGYSEDQVERELEQMAQMYGMEVDKLKDIFKGEQREYMIDNIILRNTIEFLKAETKRI